MVQSFAERPKAPADSRSLNSMLRGPGLHHSLAEPMNMGWILAKKRAFSES
jgi:hypothetical protein